MDPQDKTVIELKARLKALEKRLADRVSVLEDLTIDHENRLQDLEAKQDED